MFRLSGYVLLMLISETICIGLIPQYDIKFVTYSTWPEIGIWDVSKVRLIGRERLVNGTAMLKEDMDNDHYSFSLETFSDAAGDGNFKLLPLHIQLSPICDTFKKYRSMFSKDADYGRRTDFPIHQDICPIPKGTYYLKNIKLSSKNWPAMMPRGYLLINGSFYRDNEPVGTYSVTAFITDKEHR